MYVGLRHGGGQDAREAMPPCAVPAKSWPPSLYEALGDDSDLAQKIGRGFQVPVGAVDVDMTQVGCQSQHVLPDALTARWRGFQGPDRKGMAQLINAWPSTARGF